MMMPLFYLEKNCEAFFYCVSSSAKSSLDSTKSTSKKLLDLGLCKNKILSVANKQSDGGMLLEMDNSKIAIDRDLARRIMVIPT